MAIALLLSSGAVVAGEPRGIAFSHKDWELACDNTRTCRAAGYHPSSNGGDEDHDNEDHDNEDEALPVSVLLTRKAGPHQPVLGELQIGHGGEEDTDPGARSLAMLIDATPLGQVAFAHRQWTARLTPAQTRALLAAVLRRGSIAWTDGQRTWKLSNRGAAAVMLKMDEFQGRRGTPGALLARGGRDERTVLPAVPAPVVIAPAVPADDRVRLSTSRLAALRKALIASAGDECPALADHDRPPHYIDVRRLSGTRLVASTTCWMGASSVAQAYWAINASPPFAPRIVTTMGQGYSKGKIDASGWAGGLDCMNTDEWTWDGKRFVQTRKGTTGMCRQMGLGGAWALPELVTDVRRDVRRAAVRP